MMLKPRCDTDMTDPTQNISTSQIDNETPGGEIKVHELNNVNDIKKLFNVADLNEYE